MFSAGNVGRLLRNLGTYAVGIALAIAGALGLSAAIELSTVLAAVLFVLGLAAVVVVHEYFGGPL